MNTENTGSYCFYLVKKHTGNCGFILHVHTCEVLRNGYMSKAIRLGVVTFKIFALRKAMQSGYNPVILCYCCSTVS